MIKRLLIGMALSIAGPCATATAQIAFQEVAVSSGINYNGVSWGASWGHFDNDIYPDLWVTNHNKPFALYRNLGNGSFNNIASVVQTDTLADMHGAAWADFDNDGDQDLMQTVGAQAGMGAGSNILLVNKNGTMVDEGVLRGVDYPIGRGRTPTWLDWNRDGQLDLILANNRRPDLLGPSALLTQNLGFFTDDSQAVGFDATAPAFYVQPFGLENVDYPLIVIHGPQFPQKSYRYDFNPFVEMNATIGLSPAISGTAMDSTIGDFDNNLEPDIYLASQVDTSDIIIDGTNSVKGFLTVNGNELGVEIVTDGDLTLAVTPEIYIELTDMHIGSAGTNPPDRFFTVEVDDPTTEGIHAHTAGVDFGLYVGRDTVAGSWKIFLSKSSWIALDLLGTSTADITEVNALGFVAFDGKQQDKLMTRSGGIFSDNTTSAGLDGFTACSSVVSGDFDNDMDLDIYLGCRSMVGNNPNILLENQGDGTFVKLAGAGGAEGTTAGRGEAVIVGDYDVDGFLDLYSVNGLGFGVFSPGPDELFHNLGNSNHWLEIDLQGVIANRSGLGARVILTAGGVTQMRDLSGGVHRYAQDHARLHFGLGSNTVVDSISIRWPGGTQQAVNNIPADQLIRIVEKSQPDLIGAPTYQAGVDTGVYIWKDSASGPWHLRVSGGPVQDNYLIRVVTMAPFGNVTAVGLEAGDTLSQTATSFIFQPKVQSEEDGIDFSLASGARAMIAVSRNGIRSPKDVHAGASGKPISPTGWVFPSTVLQSLSTFTPGQDLGLFVGRDTQTNELKVRISGDGNTHPYTMLLMSGRQLGTVTPVDLGPGETLISGSFVVLAQATVATGQDGFDVSLPGNGLIGFSYWQDGLFQSHRVNQFVRNLGLADGYLLQ